MKLGLRALPAALLLAIAFAVGCSDSSETLTLDEYFAEVSAIMADMGAQAEALRDNIPDPRTSASGLYPFVDANLPWLKDLYAGMPSIISDAVDRWKALDPPSEVESAHNGFIDAGEKLVVALEAFSDLVLDVETAAEVGTFIIGEHSFIDAQEAWGDACYALADIGEANEIPVGRVCGDEGDH